jgi:hypothetical protein
MDVNDYLVAALAHERLRELRVQARMAALRADRPRARSLRVVIGQLLVRLGHRVAGVTPARAAA